MPRRPREYNLRFADQALNDLERAFDRVQILITRYGDEYPDHKAYCDVICYMITQAHENLEKFRKEFM